MSEGIITKINVRIVEIIAEILRKLQTLLYANPMTKAKIIIQHAQTIQLLIIIAVIFCARLLFLWKRNYSINRAPVS